jgi:hypothetical protein
LGIRPLWVRRDDPIRGLTHLLTLGMRLLTFIEVQVRNSVQQTGNGGPTSMRASRNEPLRDPLVPACWTRSRAPAIHQPR